LVAITVAPRTVRSVTITRSFFALAVAQSFARRTLFAVTNFPRPIGRPFAAVRTFRFASDQAGQIIQTGGAEMFGGHPQVIHATHRPAGTRSVLGHEFAGFPFELLGFVCLAGFARFVDLPLQVFQPLARFGRNLGTRTGEALEDGAHFLLQALGLFAIAGFTQRLNALPQVLQALPHFGWWLLAAAFFAPFLASLLATFASFLAPFGGLVATFTTLAGRLQTFAHFPQLSFTVADGFLIARLAQLANFPFQLL
jgi:hypothetical protein